VHQRWSPGGTTGWMEYMAATPTFRLSYTYVNPIWPF
jgi:hypothetical protein